MFKSFISLLLAGFILISCGSPKESPTGEVLKGTGITGEVIMYKSFPSSYVLARNIEVWLPPSYYKKPDDAFPVLYMHDGQNVFNPKTSYTGIDWNVDGALTELIAQDIAREAIIVALWNTEKRRAEYMPAKPLYESNTLQLFESEYGLIQSDLYLKFLVDELKPFIDTNYRTLSDKQNTMIMGSSMGGLISAYAVAEYPNVFGRAACISTHWVIGEDILVDWFSKRLPSPSNTFIYFDYGTEGLDALYEAYQLRLNKALLERGFQEGIDFVSYRFAGEDHNEAAWNARLHIPLTYLLGK